jgi:hypothetical protein
MIVRLIAPSLIALLAFACSDDSDGNGMDVTPDTSSETGETTPDATETTPDSADPDTTEPDTAPDTTADTADSAEPDTTEPADTSDPSDTAETDTSTCEYFEEREVLKCGLAFKQILHWKDFSGSGCPDYYTQGETRYDTVAELAAAEGCEDDCVYVAGQSADFFRCDGEGRSGFDIYSGQGEGCVEGVVGTPDGIFPDICLWATYACYCEEPE